MANKEMKTLRFGDVTYEIVDDKARQELSEKGKPNGIASLDKTGKVPKEQLPELGEKYGVGGEQLGLVKNGGNVVINKDGTMTVTAENIKKALDYTPANQEDVNNLAEEIVDLKAQGTQQTPLFANSIEECVDTSKLYVLPDGYIYAYMKTIKYEDGYTNHIATSINTDGSVFNEKGYKTDYRLNSSGTETALTGAICSGFIPYNGEIIRVYGDTHVSGSGATGNYLVCYNKNFEIINVPLAANAICTETDGAIWETIDGKSLWTIDPAKITTTNYANSISKAVYIRCSLAKCSTEDFVVTLNEDITEQVEIITYEWKSTGHAFVANDYEDRIIELEESTEEIKEDISGLKNTFSAFETSLITGENVPDYVVAEAQEVAEKVLAVRNPKSFCFAGISDLHTNGEGQSAISALHAGMAMNEIQARTQLDLLCIYGDVMIGYFDDSYKNGFPHVKKCFSNITKSIPFIQMQGNHDQLSADTTEEAQQKYFAHIGANNVNTITDWDNQYRIYGYKDFNDRKMRVIYLNTADVSASEITSDTHVTAEQLSWFVNTALDFSDKSDAEQWAFTVNCHHPLNWYGNASKILPILDAYKGKTSGNITLDGVTIDYDFSNVTAEFIAHFHGHLHNFRVETFGINGVLSITIPNACFTRNNEYGMSSSYGDSVNTNYGDVDENGNQRQFNKTANSAEDTAFNVIVIDRQNQKIHCFNYGAGIDREVDFDGQVITPTPDDGDEVIPDDNDNTNTDSYTNQIPLSINSDGTEFVGENGEDGYKVGYRVSTSTGNESTNVSAGIGVTGFIKLPKAATVCIKNVDVSSTHAVYAMYDDSFAFVSGGYINSRFTADDNGIYKYTFNNAEGSYIRLSGIITDESIITVS